MGQAISAVFALIMGFGTWSFVAILSKGAYPLGAAGMLEEAIFYAPIVGLVLPAALRSFGSKSPASGIWLLSLGPFVGILNFIPFFLFYASSQLIVGKTKAEVAAAYLSVGMWAFPLYLQLRTREPGDRRLGPEKPVKLLRRPGRW